MIDIDLLEKYNDWRQQNEGRMVNVSPLAYDFHVATLGAMYAYNSMPEHYGVEEMVGEMLKAWEALNAPTD